MNSRIVPALLVFLLLAALSLVAGLTVAALVSNRIGLIVSNVGSVIAVVMALRVYLRGR